MNEFLVEELLRKRLGFPPHAYHFEESYRNRSGDVVRYTEPKTFISVVVKYYGVKWIDGSQSGQPERRAALMRQEFSNLQKARDLGLTWHPHRVVRPLAVCEALGCALVEDYAPGEDLDFYIQRATDNGGSDELAARVTDVAWFLADLHYRSAVDRPANGQEPIDYLVRVTRALEKWDIINPSVRNELLELGEKWNVSGMLRAPRSALVHGDATPTHFRFAGEHDLTVIDLERMRVADPVADLGRLAAELKHLFFWQTGDRWAGEPYIRHLYESYMRYVPGGSDDFASLTARGRFYMGCDELRISRNDWLDLSYRHALIEEARACLAV